MALAAPEAALTNTASPTIDPAVYAISLWRPEPPPVEPVKVATPAPPTPPPISLELLAILEGDAGRLAAFYHPGDDAIVKAETGAMVGGYRVARIDAGEVELVHTNGARVMRLREERP